MSYDETLASRIRSYLGDHPSVTEKKMFGGLCILINGNMACGISKTDLMLRFEQADIETALSLPHTRPMDFTGKPMRTMLIVEPAGYASDTQLHHWLQKAVAFAGSLPPK